MSREVLEKTIERAAKDTRFRSSLLKDPKGTLSGLDLSREERSAITQLTNGSFDYISAQGYLSLGHYTRIANDARTLSRYNLTELAKLGD